MDQEKDTLREKAAEPSEAQAHQMVDYGADNALMRHLRDSKTVLATLEWLDEDILVSYEEEGKTIYLPVKMKRIDTYFHLIENVEKGVLLKEYGKVEVTLSGCKYNLCRKAF